MDREASTGARRRWTLWRAGLALLLCLLAMDASALRKVDPGEEPKLGPDEGLLVISVDSDSVVSSMRFDKVGSVWNGGLLRSIREGRTTRMYVVPAGRYHWAKVTLFDSWTWSSSIDLSDDDEFAFEVKPAQITYGGDLVYRSTGFLRASLRLSNRALPIIDWLQAEHPALYARLPFAYSGYYPDPFPAFFRDAQTALGTPAANLDAGRTGPDPVPLPLPPRLLWKPVRVQDVALSPDGQLVAEAVQEAPDKWALDLIDLAAGTGQRLSTSDLPITNIRWESDRILLTTTGSPIGDWLHAFHIGELAGRARGVRRVAGPFGGRMVDLLPDLPGVVLYQRLDSDGDTVVHRLWLDSDDTVRQFERARTRDRLNHGVERDLGWFADGHGVLRAAFARRGEEDVVLMHGAHGQFREVMRYQASSGFQPMQLSYEGDVFYGFTDEGRGQRDLVAFDLATGKVARTIYSKPGVDLVSVLFDERRHPIGATYYQAGRLVSDYFDEPDQHLGSLLRQAFPGRTVAAVQRSRDASKMLLWVDGSDLPPQLYLLDVARGRAELLDETVPELAGRTFSKAQVLKVQGSDGLPVEAFLTVPPGQGKRPLVVMPHGGPIGVSDDLHFNRDVQFLASLGYAVLQVNFRGSEGYGKAFREAGHRNYGTLIEDDIDAAINAAVASHPLDATRMCALGTSYGGYSAMVSTIRWPQRFRCAVSIAGVSDRALFFTASDSGRDAATRKEMERIMGNPTIAAELAEMQATSPLYRYRDLQVPVMLVHGGEDARVDYEHTRRLERMLNLAGRPPVVMEFPKEGHGLDELDNIESAWKGIAGFLRQHLGAPASVATGTAATSPVAAPAMQVP
jgi:dienelactone hydrolase